MLNQRRVSLISFLGLTIVIITVVATLRGQNPKNPSSSQQEKIEAESQFPIADYSAQEPADPVERDKRRTKSEKYNDSEMGVKQSYEVKVGNGVKGDGGVTASMLHWASGLSALPVDRSNAVVIGEVVNAKAYLSNDQTGVYSEFTVRIDSILKNDKQITLESGSSIAIERSGGRVKFPSGGISLYFTVGQGMPRIGQRYIFFLIRTNQDFQILTGYELRSGKVCLLDRPGVGHPSMEYEGVSETKILNDVQVAIANPSPSK
jgi:hypothetical protein